MSKIRAKFECLNITDNPEQKSKHVVFMAVTDGSEENESFSKYTPAGDLSLNVSYDTPASDFFKKGKEYYLDITEF